MAGGGQEGQVRGRHHRSEDIRPDRGSQERFAPRCREFAEGSPQQPPCSIVCSRLAVHQLHRNHGQAPAPPRQADRAGEGHGSPRGRAPADGRGGAHAPPQPPPGRPVLAATARRVLVPGRTQSSLFFAFWVRIATTGAERRAPAAIFATRRCRSLPILNFFVTVVPEPQALYFTSRACSVWANILL